MLTEDKITEIIVMADEFCKVFDAMHRCRDFLMGKVTIDSEIQMDKWSEGTKVFSMPVEGHGRKLAELAV